MERGPARRAASARGRDNRNGARFAIVAARPFLPSPSHDAAGLEPEPRLAMFGFIGPHEIAAQIHVRNQDCGSCSARKRLLYRLAIHWRPLDVTFKYLIAV